MSRMDYFNIVPGEEYFTVCVPGAGSIRLLMIDSSLGSAPASFTHFFARNTCHNLFCKRNGRSAGSILSEYDGLLPGSRNIHCEATVPPVFIQLKKILTPTLKLLAYVLFRSCFVIFFNLSELFCPAR